MTTGCGDFVRRLGRLRIAIRHLENGLRQGNLTDIEQQGTLIEDLLRDLTKCQHKLPRAAQLELQPSLAQIRQQALLTLEAARRILDDSLEATLALIKSVQPEAGYGPAGSGPSFMVDRRV